MSKKNKGQGGPKSFGGDRFVVWSNKRGLPKKSWWLDLSREELQKSSLTESERMKNSRFHLIDNPAILG